MTDLELLCLRLVRCLGPVKVTTLWMEMNNAHSGKAIFHALCGLRSNGLVECDKEMEWFDVTDAGRSQFSNAFTKRKKIMGASADLANDSTTVDLLKRRQTRWGPAE